MNRLFVFLTMLWIIVFSLATTPAFSQSIEDHLIQVADSRFCGVDVANCHVELGWFIPTSVGFGTHIKQRRNPVADLATWGPNFISPDYDLLETETSRLTDLLRKAFSNPLPPDHPDFPAELDANGDGVIGGSDIPTLVLRWKQYGGDSTSLTFNGVGPGRQFPPGACVLVRGLSQYFEPTEHLYQRLVSPKGNSYWSGPTVVLPNGNTCTTIIDATGR